MKIICVTGPESTGKTTLVQDLAESYNTNFLPEYAREYLTCLGRPYVEDDLLAIAHGQYAAQKKSITEHPPLVIWDTDLLVINIWSKIKYGRVDPWIRHQMRRQYVDLYILTHYDIPYEEDPLRENPEDREKLFAVYRDYLEKHRLPYFVAQGTKEERSAKIINYIAETLGLIA